MARTEANYDKTIAKGALYNGLGIAGKALFPVFFILSTRLYGTVNTGVFYLAFTIIEVALALVASGFNSGALMFASRYADDETKEDALYRSLTNGFVFSFVIGAGLVVFSFFGGSELIRSNYPQENLLGTLQIMVFGVPLVAITNIIVAATKARLTMKWDALLMGFLRPTAMLVFALLFYTVDMGLAGLSLAYLASQVIVCIIALAVFPRYFSFGKLIFHIRHFRFFGPLMKFAIPQNLNTTFNTLITNLDVLMLGYFGYAEPDLLIYGMGAQLVRNIRQVKLALSGSFSPVIAKLHHLGSTDEMNRLFSMISRWTISVGLPLAFVAALLRLDLLRLFDPTFNGDTTFVLLLLVPPLLSCGLGLAGNIVVMTGHSKWNLFNSLTVATMNASLNLFLIPRYGVLGAAGATVIAATIISILQLLEAYFLVGTKLILREVIKPYLAILPVLTLLYLYTRLGGIVDSLLMRIAASIVGVALFIGILVLLGIDPKDKEALLPWKNKSKGVVPK